MAGTGDEDVPVDGAFEAFVGMLPQTGKYASLLQQRLAEAQGEEEDDEENSSEGTGSDLDDSGTDGGDASDNGSGDDDSESAPESELGSGHEDSDNDGDDSAEDEANSAEHRADVFQRLYWGVGAEGDDDPEEAEMLEQLEAARKLDTRAIPLSAEQLGLGDMPEGHQTPFIQITAKLPTLPDATNAPFMVDKTSSKSSASSSRKRQRSAAAASDSAVTCVDLSTAYNVGAKTAHQFALYHADRRLALKRAGESPSPVALQGFDERLVVRAGPDATAERKAAFDAAVAAAAKTQPHPLQPTAPGAALLTPLQRLLLDNANDYRDLVLPVERPSNMSQIRTALALHVASHLQRARNRVIKHDSKLRSAAAARRVKKLASAVDSVQPEAAEEGGGNDKPLGGAAGAASSGAGAADDIEEEEIDADALRDQGFARCRVVVLLPFKHMALQFVRCLLTLLGQGRTVHHRKRFMEEFGDEEAKRGEPAHVQNTVGECDWVQDDFSSEGLGAAAAAKKARKGKSKPPPKRPAEHNQQFAGDVDGKCSYLCACLNHQKSTVC